jgi:hypothetical protein
LRRRFRPGIIAKGMVQRIAVAVAITAHEMSDSGMAAM